MVSRMVGRAGSKSDPTARWLVGLAVLAALMACMFLSSGESGNYAAPSAPGAATYQDSTPDGHTHTNEPGHVHTQTEWVEGYTRSDGTYVSGHYRRVE